MEKKSFVEYTEEKGITLKPWQQEAATALLTVILDADPATALGKTFLMNHLTDFINTHGNNFVL